MDEEMAQERAAHAEAIAKLQAELGDARRTHHVSFYVGQNPYSNDV